MAAKRNSFNSNRRRDSTYNRRKKKFTLHNTELNSHSKHIILKQVILGFGVVNYVCPVPIPPKEEKQIWISVIFLKVK